MHVFLSLWGNSTSWSQHSNAKHRKQNGKRPSEVHRTASHTTLTDRDENIVDICHIFSCIFWLSHLLFSTSSRFSGQTWSLLWNCMIHTSWIQRIIMSWRIPGGRSGRKGFKSLLVPNPFRSVQCGMRLFFFTCQDYSYLMLHLIYSCFRFCCSTAAEKCPTPLFIRPKKLLLSSESSMLGYVGIQTLADGMCRYDLNEEDVAWLQIANEEFSKMGESGVFILPIMHSFTLLKQMSRDANWFACRHATHGWADDGAGHGGVWAPLLWQHEPRHGNGGGAWHRVRWGRGVWRLSVPWRRGRQWNGVLWQVQHLCASGVCVWECLNACVRACLYNIVPLHRRVTVYWKFLRAAGFVVPVRWASFPNAICVLKKAGLWNPLEVALSGSTSAVPFGYQK